MTLLSPTAVLKQAFASHTAVTLSFSGAEDVALIDMACQLTNQVHVFSLDTGRLHPETYQFIEKVREHYGIDIDVISPDGTAVAKLVKQKGLYSFYKDGHQECCGVRKIEPLRRYLNHWQAWITGQRCDQSPTRSNVPQQQTDTTFSTETKTMMKYNPLAKWSSAQVWQYIRDHDVPYNSLYDKGYMSIGCEPCTRPISPHEHERAGRWWWEAATQKECGLHLMNVSRI